MRTLNKKYSGDKDLKEFILQNSIAEEKNILLQVFTGICEIDFIENLIQTVKESIPHVKIIGTTTDGEILEDNIFENSTILSFSLFQETNISTYFTEAGEDSYKTAGKLISKFDDTLHPKVAITFADGLHINGEEYINAFNDYNKKLVVAGGLAGDNAKFINTIVFTQDKVVMNGAVIALLFNDNLEVNTKASFGWENIGKTMTITKSKQNIVYEIDNIKAVDIYAKYLGDDIALELPKTGIEFPLIIKRKELSIPRAVVGKNSDGSLVFAGNLNIGDRVTFGYGNIETIINYGENIYFDSKMKKSESIFIYSCMARKALMQDSIKEELTPLCYISDISGFFTYGEFYSDTESLSHELLNQTMTILSLSENISHKNPISKLSKRTIIKDRRKNNLTLKALSHLVSQTSKELEEINASLKLKVRQEVAKNRKKDKQMMQQSRLAQMGEMISMIAHQWRQPLAAISSTSIGINIKAELGKLDRDTAIELSDKISSYAQHLSATIDDFREFFKSNKEKRNTTYCELIKNVLDIVKVSIENQNIELIIIKNCKRTFYTYPNEIKQVILNLIKNAEDILLERRVKNPKITIETKDGILTISDNGGGIPTDIMDKIFDPYFSTKTKKDGTGLGLYMSKTIVDEHCGGELSVSNDEEGAVFKVELPLSLEK